MKIKFQNKKWFNFLRYKLPHNTLISSHCLSDLDSSNGTLELIVAGSRDDLEKWIKEFTPGLSEVGLKSCQKESKPWNHFKYYGDGFEKEIRFCHSSSFNDGKYSTHEIVFYKPGRFLDDFTFDTTPPNDYKEKEKNKMANNNSGIWGMTKEDFKDGLWRNGANEMVEVVKFGILKACKLQKMNKLMYEGIKRTLDYKITTGAIHAGLGYALTYVPMLSAHPNAARMAKELRVEGFKFMQAEVIGAIKDLVPDLLEILSTSSPEEESEQRIKVEEKVETKRISAPELTEHQASIEAMAEKEVTVQAKRTATI